MPRVKKWQTYYIFAQQALPKAKYKFVVIAHIEEQHNYTLGFFVNSRVTKFIRDRPTLMACEVFITAEKHSFLEYDSFIDCQNLYTFPLKDLTDFRGDIASPTIAKILAAIESCESLTEKHKHLLLGNS